MATERFDAIDKLLINDLQLNFPICERPFAELAERYRLSEEAILSRLQNMLDQGLLTRFGPLFDAACMGGAFTLAAIETPEDRFDEVADIVNALQEIAHNYRREHRLNMWFVIGTEQAEDIANVINTIEQQTGLVVHNMPKQEEFYVGLYLPIE